jgi:hypothetical protein
MQPLLSRSISLSIHPSRLCVHVSEASRAVMSRQRLPSGLSGVHVVAGSLGFGWVMVLGADEKAHVL